MGLVTDIATATTGGKTVAVRVDGEWCEEVYYYTEHLPVFFIDGAEIDVRPDGTVMYETPGGAVQTMVPYVEEGGVASFMTMSVYPHDSIEVHDINESEAADFPRGETA